MKNGPLRIIAGVLSVCIGVFAPGAPEAQAAPCHGKVTVKQLLAREGAYANQVVCAVGVFHPQFEGDNLSLNEDTVWLSLYGSGPNYSKQKFETDRQRALAWSRLYQDKCVVVQGRFNPRQTGHLAAWEPGIESIQGVSAENSLSCFPAKAPTAEDSHAGGRRKSP